MAVFILIVLINLLHLSKEAIELKQFETTQMSNLYCYLDTSIYRKYDYITFTIKYGSSFGKPNDLVLYSRFDNNLILQNYLKLLILAVYKNQVLIFFSLSLLNVIII